MDAGPAGGGACAGCQGRGCGAGFVGGRGVTGSGRGPGPLSGAPSAPRALGSEAWRGGRGGAGTGPRAGSPHPPSMPATPRRRLRRLRRARGSSRRHTGLPGPPSLSSCAGAPLRPWGTGRGTGGGVSDASPSPGLRRTGDLPSRGHSPRTPEVAGPRPASGRRACPSSPKPRTRRGPQVWPVFSEGCLG